MANEMGGVASVAARPLAAALAAGAAFYVASNSVLFTDAGMIYVVQNNLTGGLDVYAEPGMHRRVPFFSTVTAYRQVITSNFEDGAASVRFSSSFSAWLQKSLTSGASVSKNRASMPCFL